jgi:hypothetical protein
VDPQRAVGLGEDVDWRRGPRARGAALVERGAEGAIGQRVDLAAGQALERDELLVADRGPLE